MYPYIAVSMLVGIRTEEMRTLRWDHVSLDADPPVVHVWRSVRKSGDTKTKKSRRTLAIPDVAAQAPRRRRREQEPTGSRPATPGRRQRSSSRRLSAHRWTLRTFDALSGRP
ncbi:hypothetical protein [Xylanimonas sp. McL0601]|uniref:hypothetical protein n=1 Tax=Xylanimonas sp. McL0601 TaxID=3414739 RepID=UPI003CEE886E